jgi:HEAT repeat protein
VGVFSRLAKMACSHDYEWWDSTTSEAWCPICGHHSKSDDLPLDWRRHLMAYYARWALDGGPEPKDRVGLGRHLGPGRRVNLEELESQRDVAGLIEALNWRPNGGKHYYPESAARRLVKIGDTAVRRLIEALDGEWTTTNEYWSRTEIVRILGKIGDRRAVEPLVALLAVDPAHLRSAKDFGDDGIQKVVALGTALELRESAAEALGLIGDKEAVEPLIACYRDDSLQAGVNVRTAVVIALGKLRDPRALDTLTAALKDKDSKVRDVVQAAIDQVRGVDATPKRAAAPKPKKAKAAT